MAYIGNDPSNRFVAPKAASVFSGDGSTTAFTLDHAVGSDEDILVSVDGVIQEPSVAYAVSSGTTLTFTAAPSSNSGNNIFVYYLFRTVGTVSPPSNNALTATNGTLTGTLDVTGASTLTGALSAKGGAVFNQDSADVDFRVESNNNTHALFVDGGNDKIGMFTDSPSAKLHIKTNSSGGTAQSRSALVIEDDGGNADSIQFLTNDSGFQSIFFGDASDNDVGRLAYSHSGDNMRFSAGATESMRATSDSVGGLGHTGGNGAISSEGFVFRKNTNGNHLEIGHASGAGDGFSFLICRRAGTSIGGISQDGTTGVDFDTSSDYRLKENVTYNFDATTRLKKLKPCRFNFIVEPDRTVDGFLAHEVEDAVPQAVKGEKDAVDEEGNINSQMIDHSKLVPLMVKTIQELEARIATLESK